MMVFGLVILEVVLEWIIGMVEGGIVVGGWFVCGGYCFVGEYGGGFFLLIIIFVEVLYDSEIV